jgi:hypothetical protein
MTDKNDHEKNMDKRWEMLYAFLGFDLMYWNESRQLDHPDKTGILRQTKRIIDMMQMFEREYP